MGHKCSREECGPLLGYHHYWYFHKDFVEGCAVCDAEKKSQEGTGGSA